ncbi:MAG TPA: uridine diphosphate-N-acetylglucosamine-binding protein YvcK, partial [Blastocatellia bacterium]|nr:uridine diphosphate-N-acetylglucosamine-binding protein YvcK [Blastocatellia bacterium]
HLLTRLFQYRFESDGDLSGHSFGNLFLAALAGVTGDFLEALKMTSEVLAIKGRIFPSTVEDVALVAELEDGRIIQGETRIAASRSRVKRLSLSCEPCRPLPETLEAIREADIITVGPGSLYTSIVPNLLVDDIVDTICESDALKIYVCNIMTQPGETEGFFVEDHLRVLFEYSPQLKLDYVVVNSAPITPALREKYLADGSVQVEFESDPESSLGRSADAVSGFDHKPAPDFRIISGDLLNEHDVVRHDPHKLARLLFDIYDMNRLASRRSVRAL